MTNRADLDRADAVAYYVGEVEALLHTCKHYLDIVERVISSDIHDRNKHRNALSLCAEMLEEWLSGRTDQVEEWQKVRRLTSDTALLVGLAAIWLQEKVQ